MVETRNRGQSRARRPGRQVFKSAWSGFSVTSLEADLAYFQARLELLGKPDTINKKAQEETFRFLLEAMNGILSKLKRRQRAGADHG